MISFPIWRNERMLNSLADPLNYYITFNDATIYSGRAHVRPGGYYVEIPIDRVIRDYLENTMDVEYDGVYGQPGNYGVFNVYQTGTDTLLAEYGVLLNCQDEWSGQTMVLADTVNGHLDPRMRFFWSKYNTGQTTEVITTEDIYYFNAESAVTVAWDAGVAIVNVNTNYPYAEIHAVCPEGVRELRYGEQYMFEVPVNETETAVTHTVQWYRRGVLLGETVITVSAVVWEFACDTTASIGSLGGRLSISYTTNIPERLITVGLPEGWSVVSFANGTLVLNVPLNTSADAFTGYVTFSMGGNVLGTCVVTQAGTVHWFNVPSRMAIPWTGATVTIPIDTDYDISQISASAGSGVTIGSKTQTGLTVTASANSGETIDERPVVFTMGGVEIGRTVLAVLCNYAEQYLTIEAISGGTLGINIHYITSTIGNPVTFDYRKNGGNWNTVSFSGDTYNVTGTVTAMDPGDIVELRANDLRGQFVATGNYTTLDIPFASKVYGNIMSVEYGDNFALQTALPANPTGTGYMNSFSLFSTTKIVDAVGLVLPATTLVEGAYAGMFEFCYDLKYAPLELPAPVAETKAYNAMFSKCSALETAPAIKATRFKTRACSDMFDTCTSLTEAPEIDADVDDYGCYGMYSGCTALVRVQQVLKSHTPGYQVGQYCYASMFDSCSSLVVPPQLPDTKLADYCYRWMFNKTAIISAPSLPATVMKKGCYQFMFHRCVNLINAPSLPGTTLAESCYDEMFSACSSLVNLPSLPATEMKKRCYSGMFADTSAVQAPALPAMTLADSCYVEMFMRTKIKTAPALPATVLANDCYWAMFSDCYDLERSPELPAPTIVGGTFGSYFSMFLNCTKLNYVKCLATNASTAYSNGWIGQWLRNVSATGTFEKAQGVTWSQSGDEYSGRIPPGWTIRDA